MDSGKWTNYHNIRRYINNIRQNYCEKQDVGRIFKNIFIHNALLNNTLPKIIGM